MLLLTSEFLEVVLHIKNNLSYDTQKKWQLAAESSVYEMGNTISPLNHLCFKKWEEKERSLQDININAS